MTARTPRTVTGNYSWVVAAVALLVACWLPLGAATRSASTLQQAQPSAFDIRIEGQIKSLSPVKWLVGEVVVLVDESTLVNPKRGPAEVGAWVIVWGSMEDSGLLRARTIVVDRPAGASTPSLQFTGVVKKQLDTLWVIDQLGVRIDATTTLVGAPHVGHLVWIIADQPTQIGEDPTAVLIEAIAESPAFLPADFEGVIERMGPDGWAVGGTAFETTPNTQFIGVPDVGKIAEVRARLPAENGIPQALLVRVIESTELAVGALVTGVSDQADGSQDWEVLVFQEEPWSTPEIGKLHVSSSTLVDESRAVARPGQWVDVQGIRTSQDDYEAWIVRVELPVPISLQGVLDTPRLAQAAAVASPWRTIGGRPVLVPANQTTTATALAEQTVRVEGILLGNGVVWVQQLRPGGAAIR